ncbi:unnamed protein product [Fructobacillus tropaeoli]|uniref:hypothetical protein n=1 Tax=Fructobacillus tropaeoli TaxID=709323 RepID=UPI002D8D0AAF|nr:unnamed protein product [Fructobacillus tropaeoli]
MDYKVVEVGKFGYISGGSQVTRAENKTKLFAKEGWRLISTVFTDECSIILFFERNKNDEED